MKKIGIIALLKEMESFSGKEATLNRLKAMRDYAKLYMKEHPHEKCADALDDNMHLIEAVLTEAERMF